MKILKINSSGNTYNSVTRHHVDLIVDKLNAESAAEVTERDVVNSNIPFIGPDHLAAMFSKEELTKAQVETLALSNELVDELLENDVLVIGAPMYNFGVPAALKAYFDMIARSGRTFSYSSEGPKGLITGKKAYIVISTGGTPIGSPYDFSKAYLKTFLGFLGIGDIEFIIADEGGMSPEDKNEKAQDKLAELVY